MKILNLYAGLGGNRKHWDTTHEVTAVEYTKKIADTYAKNFPNDTVVVGDAHEYLLNHFEEFDFIWSSPPCQSHSRMIRGGKNRTPRYPDMRLYEEILFLIHNFEGLWVVENVVPYYGELIPATTIGRHLFWSNFDIEAEDVPRPPGFISKTNVEGSEQLKEWLGIQYEGNIYYDGNHCPAQVLRNCVHPDLGKQILTCVEEQLAGEA
jgi:DNA (cytosine-5)-methyltransferase 1